MLKKLIENPEKYYWTTNSDGDVILGNSDLGLKAVVTFTWTTNWVNMSPLVEEIPGKFIGHPESFQKGSKNYNLISDLIKTIQKYLKTEPKQDRELTSHNTLLILQDYYKDKG